MITYSNAAAETSYIDWEIQADFNHRGLLQLSASNFQDIFNMTKRIGEVETKMGKIKFRTQGIGGMLGIAAGALGGPLGSVIGFGIGRSIGGFIGNAMSNKYYGEEQMMINENLFMARQRDGQIKYMIGEFDGAESMLSTMRQNSVNDDKKILQDMMVL
jgi:outer membrane lipoprotein SlyB